MPKTRTVELTFELLKPKEKEQFQYFLESKTGDKQHKVYLLFEALDQALPIKQLWTKVFPRMVFPKDPFSNIKYRKLEFKLCAYIEEFLAIQAFRQSKSTRDLFLIKALNNRDAGKLFEAKLKKTRLRLEKKTVRDETYFRSQYLLERENQHYLYKQLLKVKGSIAPSLSKAFEIYWLHEKFRLAIANLNHKQVTGIEVPAPFFQEILSYARMFPKEEYPVLYIYRTLYETFADALVNQDLFSLIYTHKELFDEDALKDIYATTLNYYVRLINSTNSPEFLEKLFEHYRWGIENRLVFRDNVLAWDYYKNFVTIGLHLKKYKFTREFIEEYKVFLPDDHREEAYRFSLAQYHFTQYNFKECIKLLNLKFFNVYYEIQARFLALQAHYELGTDADLLRSLRSLRVFIGRQKTLSKAKKNLEANRVKLFEKLVKAFTKKNYEQLYEEILNDHSIGNRQWLLEKIDKGRSAVRI